MIVLLLLVLLAGCGQDYKPFANPSETVVDRSCEFRGFCARVDLHKVDDWLTANHAAEVVACGMDMAIAWFPEIEKEDFDDAHFVVSSDLDVLQDYYTFRINRRYQADVSLVNAFTGTALNKLTTSDWLAVMNEATPHTTLQQEKLVLHEMGHHLALKLNGDIDPGHTVGAIWKSWLPVSVEMCAGWEVL